MDIIEDRFWMNVDGLCAQKGIKTPSELSRLMGRAYNYANRIRNGGSVLSESKAYEIAKALGVTLGYLVSSERLPSESIRIPIEGPTVCAILKASSVLPEEDLAAIYHYLALHCRKTLDDIEIPDGKTMMHLAWRRIAGFVEKSEALHSGSFWIGKAETFRELYLKNTSESDRFAPYHTKLSTFCAFAQALELPLDWIVYGDSYALLQKRINPNVGKVEVYAERIRGVVPLLDLDKDSENLVLALLNERLLALASTKGL